MTYGKLFIERGIKDKREFGHGKKEKRITIIKKIERRMEKVNMRRRSRVYVKRIDK